YVNVALPIERQCDSRVAIRATEVGCPRRGSIGSNFRHERVRRNRARYEKFAAGTGADAGYLRQMRLHPSHPVVRAVRHARPACEQPTCGATLMADQHEGFSAACGELSAGLPSPGGSAILALVESVDGQSNYGSWLIGIDLQLVNRRKGGGGRGLRGPGDSVIGRQ